MRERERERERGGGGQGQTDNAHQPRKTIELAKTSEASRAPRKTGRTSGVGRQAATGEGGVAPVNGGQVRAAAGRTVAARTPRC